MNKNLSIKNKIVYIIALSAVFGIVISLVVYNVFNYNTKQEIYKEVKSELVDDISKSIHDKKLVLLSSAIALSTNIEVINAIKTNQREPLIWLFRKNHRMIQNSTNYKNVKFHIHSKDGFSFFRNWKAHSYGDDLKSYRHSVNHVKNIKKSIVTIESGKFGIFINAIAPIFDKDGNFIGSIEAKGGFDSLSSDFLKVDKNFVTLMSDKMLKYRTNKLTYIDEYVVSHKKVDKEFLSKISELDFRVLKKDGYVEDRDNIYVKKIVKDFSGNEVGMFIISQSKQKVEKIISENNKLAYILLSMMVIIFVIIGGFMSSMLKKHIILPLNSLQNGLLDFFNYLSGEKKEIQEIELDSTDEIGVMAKEINKNIIKLNKEFKKDNIMIDELISCVQKVEDGRLDSRIESDPSKKELEKVKTFFNQMIKTLEKNIGKDINNILDNLRSYQEQDYSKKIKNPTGKVEKSLNQLSDTIVYMMSENRQNGINLKQKAENLFDSIEVINSNASEQNHMIEDTISNLNEVSDSLKNQAKNAKSMQSYSNSVTLSATLGSKLAENTTTSIQEITSTVKEINTSIDIIDNIVLQTNILSLNASVEASTAGEAGKGFAVVANEVRNLAAKSQEAAKTIRNIVNLAQQKADDGKVIISEMTNGYEKLQTDIVHTVQLIKESIELTKVQEENLNNISKFAQTLKNHANENTSAIENTVNIAQQTNTMATDLVRGG